jgi:hypothetical protein
MSKGNEETQRRIDAYENIRNVMAAEGFHEKICTVSILKANAMVFVTSLPIAALCILIYFFRWHLIAFPFSRLPQTLLFLILMILSFGIHEVIHGLTWSRFCKNKWNSIHLGIMWKTLTPYCHCQETLKYRGYILGALMPLFILGLGTFVVSMLIGSTMILFLALINIFAAGGDITIVSMMLRHKSAFVYDHPTECGFIAFYK